MPQQTKHSTLVIMIPDAVTHSRRKKNVTQIVITIYNNRLWRPEHIPVNRIGRGTPATRLANAHWLRIVCVCVCAANNQHVHNISIIDMDDHFGQCACASDALRNKLTIKSLWDFYIEYADAAHDPSIDFCFIGNFLSHFFSLFFSFSSSSSFHLYRWEERTKKNNV